ncbi:MAG TPA: hypothetical protein VFR33_11035 [Candidatus Dormibacteraeota bacterium]|nr:hypothetical protein [Candidatus Dormibacteraeota bacterium]
MPVILSEQTGSAGWVSLPVGSFSADSTGASIVASAHRADGIVINGPTFSSQRNAWVPYSAEQLSPDQRRYAYLLRGYEQNGPVSYGLHTANTDGSGDRTLATAQMVGIWKLLGWRAEGIFISETTGSHNSLLRFDATTGAEAVVDRGDSRRWDVMDHATFWGVGSENGDPPTPFPTIGNADRLMTLDPESGEVATRFYEPHSLVVGVLGFDRLGNPVFATYDGTNVDVSYLPGPGQRKVIETDPMGQGIGPNGGGQPDALGVWFGSSEGVIRFFDGTSMRRVANLNTRVVQIAGPCVPAT